LILSALATSVIVECLLPPFALWPEALATFFGGQQRCDARLSAGPCLESVEPLGVLGEKSTKIVFCAFDLLRLDGKDLRSRPLRNGCNCCSSNRRR
jgi:hypothetical protein